MQDIRVPIPEEFQLHDSSFINRIIALVASFHISQNLVIPSVSSDPMARAGSIMPIAVLPRVRLAFLFEGC